MEACGGAQHWARRLRALGHEVRLVPVKLVRPFVSGNKNDVQDARAIRRPSGPAVSSPPGSGWCLATAALVGGCACWASPSAGIPICGPC